MSRAWSGDRGHRLRHAVAERDGWRCFYCFRSLRCRRCEAECVSLWAGATLDHRLARSRGGQDDLANLVLSCERCNAKKADGPANKLTTGFLGRQRTQRDARKRPSR